ncbi:unnamed protein product [Spirodela intermedia]|uniref:Uncharacterized protein n=1 Tax=Spirodela intermedia TaxID=51605 RepID=A0A7I8I8Q3_SPIIN|nr:unnamed protein product [Spirodela intermedia]CAA6653898.1 unnamed protein product [Spirodela intermedia]
MNAFADSAQDPSSAVQVVLENSLSNDQPSASSLGVHPVETPTVDTRFYSFGHSGDRPPSLCIAVIGATGELARSKVFPALFALFYSGFLPENVGIFGYSRKPLTDEDLRKLIAETLTCRVDHNEKCGDKLNDFLGRTYHINARHDNKEGMRTLNSRMESIEGNHEANRIFYLSVPQEALSDVSSCLADFAQTQKGWNRIIIEKPFGFDAASSRQLTSSLLSKFEEKQIYRFSNLVFEPLWSRTYIRNVQVILSEDCGIESRRRYFDGYGIIRDVVHSHILQTIALFAMEPPYLTSLTPTFFAAALYIDNARWDGVPFLIKAGMGLIKHRVEIRIQFNHVPGNIYRERIGHNIDLTTNELILRDAPARPSSSRSTTRYNVEVPDSYEHLLLDVVDGDAHLFLRSDELEAAWELLTPVLHEIDEQTVSPELYEFGGRGPVGAYYLGAKHGVRWADD